MLNVRTLKVMEVITGSVTPASALVFSVESVETQPAQKKNNNPSAVMTESGLFIPTLELQRVVIVNVTQGSTLPLHLQCSKFVCRKERMMEHSLRSVTAAGLAQENSKLPLRSMVMLTGWLLDETNPLLGDGFTRLLTGQQDSVIPRDETTKAFQTLHGHQTLGIVHRMSHYDWSDDNSASEFAASGDKTRLRDTKDSRYDALKLLDKWIGLRLQNNDVRNWTSKADGSKPTVAKGVTL